MAILTLSGRVVIAESIAAQPIHLAWGLGNGSWITPPSEDAEATALINEIGRRTATQVQYVVPDENGAIVLPSGNFTVSTPATNHLFISTQFDFTDASSAIVREIGVFVGTVMVTGLPGGTTYFVPANIDEPGRLLHVENIEPIYRSTAIREKFEIVISF